MPPRWGDWPTWLLRLNRRGSIVTTIRANYDAVLYQTRPADHGLQSAPPHPANEWSLPSSYALADKLFSRVPSVRVMKECLAKLAPPSTTRRRPKRRSRLRPTRA